MHMRVSSNAAEECPAAPTHLCAYERSQTCFCAPKWIQCLRGVLVCSHRSSCRECIVHASGMPFVFSPCERMCEFVNALLPEDGLLMRHVCLATLLSHLTTWTGSTLTSLTENLPLKFGLPLGLDLTVGLFLKVTLKWEIFRKSFKSELRTL